MKKVIFATITLIIFCVAFSLHIRRETDRFVQSQPEIPQQTHVEHPIDTGGAESQGENQNSENTTEVNVWEATPADAPPALHRDPTHSQNRDTQYRIQQNETVKVFAPEDQDAEQENSGKKPLSIEDLSVEQIIENNRRYLINKHGNIPEIDIYLKLNASFYESIKNQEPEYVRTFTPEESLEYRRVVSILYPTQANIKAYQDELERMEEWDLR